MTDYGPFKDIVATAGSIIAAGTAVGLSFRGRAKWEPSEQDIPRGPQRVGVLISSIAIALMWVEWRDGKHNHDLVTTAILLAIATFVFLCLYGYLTAVQTYTVDQPGGATRRIIGGFWIKRTARDRMKKGNEAKPDGFKTKQEYFEASGSDVDAVWPRASRALAKISFVLGYLGLTVCGTVALGAAAIRVGLAVG